MNNTDKEKLKEFFNNKGLKQEDIAKALNISQPLVSAYLNDKPFGKQAAKKWGETFGLSPNWLLIGVGEMEVKSNVIEDERSISKYKAQSVKALQPARTYPLIPIEAIAGFGTEDNVGVTYQDCKQYQIPDFEARGVEFFIRVSGSSMYPKYSNGAILACKKITDILFLQWGKIYVIDSSQGALVKRVFEDKENPDNIICVSENKRHYPPFAIPKRDIRSLSLVLGSINMD